MTQNATDVSNIYDVEFWGDNWNLQISKMDYVDVIHGKIELPNYIASIIKTPQFQRLKKIHQLGMYHIVYPEANHTRYDHCIGTYFLANKAIDCLEKNTKGLEIPEMYRKAVTIAALLHDIGHGPFSHSWEFFCERYNHEEMASPCIDEIFKEADVTWPDSEYALNLIKALIVGDASCIRDREYVFLFEIVSNKQCNVDVDKWDYLKRDHVMMRASVSKTDLDDVFLNARASDDRIHIEYRYVDYPKLYSIFEMRAALHINFYQEPKLICLDQILKYIIHNAHDLGHIDGRNLLEVRGQHTKAFLKLNEEEIWRIIRKIQSPSEVMELIKVLENHNLLKEVYPRTNEQKESVPKHLKVEIMIPFPGEEMHEENMHFYGNELEKPKIKKQMGYYMSTSYFEICS